MIFTVRIAAKEFIRAFFIMFYGHDAAAEVTFLIDGLVPENEIALRIFAAAVEDAAPLGLALNLLPFCLKGDNE